MPAKLIEQTNNILTIQFTVELTGQMLADEQSLQVTGQLWVVRSFL